MMLLLYTHILGEYLSLSNALFFVLILFLLGGQHQYVADFWNCAMITMILLATFVSNTHFKHTHSRIRTPTHTHARAHTHAHTHTYTRINIQKAQNLNSCLVALIVRAHTWLAHAHARTHAHAHKHANTLTNIHTPIYQVRAGGYWL